MIQEFVMKVKIFAKELRPKQNFWNKPIESLDCGLETEINAWLATNSGIAVKEIKQTLSGGSFMPAKLVISLWY